jgi:cysteine desulfurase
MDNPSTTMVDPRVLDAMLPFLTERFGNAASRSHVFGWDAEKAVEAAREQVAGLIGASAKEVVFTSGGTEANNLAIKGVAGIYREEGDHVITCSIDQKSILDPCRRLERLGYRVTYLPVDKHGLMDIDALREAITDKTILLTTMFANNEIGTLQPIAEIGPIARKEGILFHVDATQAAGRVPVDVQGMGIDLLSLTGHLIHAPKGIGALYVRRKNPRVRLTPLIEGGGHERGFRSGTLNVPGAVALGKACEICRAEMTEESKRVAALRDILEQGILSSIEEVYVNGHPERRLPGITNMSFAYVEGEALMMGMRDVAVSSGSACTSATLEPSHVLRAIGVDDGLAHTSVRYGLGRFNTLDEVRHVIEATRKAVARLREMSPLYQTAKQGIDTDAIQWPDGQTR